MSPDTATTLSPYQKIAAELRHQIFTGGLAVGAKLPSEHTLAGAHRVARTTVQSALRVLRTEGLISSRKGAGNFVTALAVVDAHRCPARVELDHQQVGWLSRLPRPAHGLDRVLHCELEHPHPGAHAGLGQHAAGIGWWVQWSLAATEINAIANCTAIRTAGHEDDNHCLLYRDHPNRHLFGSDYSA
ncbi:winged helix-turn-helix domain-containing protein [Actinoplanes sp. Pm04-4]|jgi:DNA-binding transcriptional regulator YhcF (GntR family)|uniref:Winged helix-turn-helix domain-containing protein n=1 Tax=Paractinoplanes pyxinae TaxID=2997416 RepID=A0ABT4BF88_9ACTN|nr:winged helix-turn-helix domain-containing protein [Actinoplanes pyxinae]MCY1144460.1 winged helix-turn-helix domain-containing protein [Actinoplanes pyxinae]